MIVQCHRHLLVLRPPVLLPRPPLLSAHENKLNSPICATRPLCASCGKNLRPMWVLRTPPPRLHRNLPGSPSNPGRCRVGRCQHRASCRAKIDITIKFNLPPTFSYYYLVNAHNISFLMTTNNSMARALVNSGGSGSIDSGSSPEYRRRTRSGRQQAQ